MLTTQISPELDGRPLQMVTRRLGRSWRMTARREADLTDRASSVTDPMCGSSSI
jgi:hypothetical protein